MSLTLCNYEAQGSERTATAERVEALPSCPTSPLSSWKEPLPHVVAQKSKAFLGRAVRLDNGSTQLVLQNLVI
jgi:hypothetical protein